MGLQLRVTGGSSGSGSGVFCLGEVAYAGKLEYGDIRDVEGDYFSVGDVATAVEELGKFTSVFTSVRMQRDRVRQMILGKWIGSFTWG